METFLDCTLTQRTLEQIRSAAANLPTGDAVDCFLALGHASHPSSKPRRVNEPPSESIVREPGQTLHEIVTLDCEGIGHDVD
jgi:hypothetical protein